MQLVIRSYSGKGSTELFDVLASRVAELEPLMRSIPGLVSYSLARTPSGGVSVTICQDQIGIDESIRRAKDWIVKNAGNVVAEAPTVSVGNVIARVN